MKKSLFILCCFCSLTLQAKVLSIQELMKVKMGSSLGQAQSEAAGRGYDYSIETADGKVISIMLNFIPAVKAEPYLKKAAKGFCLIQGIGGDVKHNRFFFFPANEHRRYEITHSNMVRSILIKDMPGAKTNQACELKDLLKLQPEKETVRVVK